MLQIIRSKVTSIFVKILFVLLIVSFAIWGIGDIFFGSPAGKVAVDIGDDVRYTTQEVAAEFDTARRRIGVPLTAEQAVQLGVLDQVIDNLVTEGLMTAATRQLDLSVSTDRLVEFVRTRFVDATGQFDRSRYQIFLSNNGWSEEEFIRRLRQDFAKRQLIDALVAVDQPPAPIVDRLFAYREERRVAEAVTIPAAAVEAPGEPEAPALATYFDANKTRYEEPEYRNVTWAEISPAKVAESIEVPEAELRAAYDERAEQLATPERREVQQILFESAEAAKAARDRIAAGEDFAAVAKDATGADAAALDLGLLARDGLPDGTADAVFALPQDEVGQPVESAFGWHLFRVRAIQAGSTVSFEEAKPRLRDEIARERALDQVYEAANKVEDALAGGSTLEEAARTMDMAIRSQQGLARSGRLKSGGEAQGLPGGNFTELAFATQQGQLSSLGEGEGGVFFVLRVDGVEPARVPTLDEVRDRVVADWKSERRLEIAEERGDALAEKLRGGGNLSELAAADQMPTATLPAITRSGRDLPPGFPRTLPATLFGIKEVGGVAVAADDTQVVVLQLKAVQPADAAGQKDVRDGIAGQISEGIESDVIELLLADLRTRIGVEVDRDSVRRLFETTQ